ncbi:MAG: hypothetical protein AMXMBFR82_40680 [Candidatus Hydrogenedentota bacterium]
MVAGYTLAFDEDRCKESQVRYALFCRPIRGSIGDEALGPRVPLRFTRGYIRVAPSGAK